jgi:CspA family cold shock protein
MDAREARNLFSSVECAGRYEMATGIVKWFNAARGFGFIEQQDDGADVFAHFSNLVDQGLLGLVEGQKVSFDLRQSPKGLHAENIVCE